MSGLALPGPLVSVIWLAERIGQPGLVILDASLRKHRDPTGRLPGAAFFDIDGVFSDAASLLPHTMPSPEAFTDAIRELGVNDSDTVVAYDATGIYSSPRAWWMLRAMGFDRVAVLDGGLPAWRDAGEPIEAGPPGRRDRGSFAAQPRPTAFCGSAEVLDLLGSDRAAVLDARSRERFRGEVAEPRAGLARGHMPGSGNLPFEELIEDGRLRPADELRRLFEEVAGSQDRLVVSCGSGVTACVLALAAEVAGYRGTSVYDGSWSEWGAGELPVTRGDEVSGCHRP